MKILQFSGLLVLLLLFACKTEVDLIEEQIGIPSSVQVEVMIIEGAIYSDFQLNYSPGRTVIPYATVKLVYDGIILDEVTPNINGQYQFAEQPVPLEKAYILVEAPNFFPTARRTLFDQSVLFNNINLIPINYPDFSNHALSKDKEMIQLTGKIEIRDKGYFVYALDKLGNLIGNSWLDPDRPHDLTLTTRANEVINLHVGYHNCIMPTPIQLGPFDTDTDVGQLSFEDLAQENFVPVKGSMISCAGLPAIGHLHLFQGDRYLQQAAPHSNNTFSHSLRECELNDEPISLLMAYIEEGEYNFYNYGKATTNYISGQDIELTISTCNENNTHFTYSINGANLWDEESLTFALKSQAGPLKLYVNDIAASDQFNIEIDGATPGAHKGSIAIIKSWQLESYSDELTFTITDNTGELVVGTFEGPLVNDNYEAMGEITGAFTAVLQ